MVMKPKTIAAGQFKAECLALLDRVARTGQPIIVTKRGKPVARLVPLEETPEKSLAGSVLFDDDLVSPIEDEWDALL